MTTLPFPKSAKPCNTAKVQTQKKDIAALLNNHVHPNHNTTLTLSDHSGKTLTINCNTDDPSGLLDTALIYLSN